MPSASQTQQSRPFAIPHNRLPGAGKARDSPAQTSPTCSPAYQASPAVRHLSSRKASRQGGHEACYGLSVCGLPCRILEPFGTVLVVHIVLKVKHVHAQPRILKCKAKRKDRLKVNVISLMCDLLPAAPAQRSSQQTPGGLQGGSQGPLEGRERCASRACKVQPDGASHDCLHRGICPGKGFRCHGGC